MLAVATPCHDMLFHQAILLLVIRNVVSGNSKIL